MRTALITGLIVTASVGGANVFASDYGVSEANAPYRLAYDYGAFLRQLVEDEEPAPAPPPRDEDEAQPLRSAPVSIEAPEAPIPSYIAPPTTSYQPRPSYDCATSVAGCGDACGCGAGCGCGSACNSGGLLSGMPGTSALESLSLAKLAGLECSCLEFGGWTQMGYHSNNTPLSQAYGDGLAFNDVPDNLNLHQQWFYMGKTADGSRGLDWGFRTDFIYGTDAQKTQAFGNPAGSFDEGWDHGVYGWAIPQLYGELAYGDLSVKMGHFFTLVGYEVITAPDNFFYSHAYTMFNSEPFTHTGVLATYSGFENMTLYGGWTLGWDTGFDNLNQGNSWLGGFSMNLSDNVTMTYINTYGNFGAIDSAPGFSADDSYSHSLVFDVALTDKLNYVFQTDNVRIKNPGANVLRDDIGINQYLLYRYNDVVSLGQRIEWWKQDGTSYYEATSGVNVKLLDNLVWRPEYRVDWSPGANVDERTFGMDMILTY
ncbi:MAG: porin [Planctomycetales bacterium]|nr:porin [Planctomycetales bacterium]